MCGGTPTVTITISASSETPYPPTIDDGTTRTSTVDGDKNLVTLVNSGSNMVFKFSGDISAITAINETDGTNVFKSPPTRNDDGSWQGTIDSLPVGTEESYSITYMVNGAPDNPYTQDPKIKINK